MSTGCDVGDVNSGKLDYFWKTERRYTGACECWIVCDKQNKKYCSFITGTGFFFCDLNVRLKKKKLNGNKTMINLCVYTNREPGE